MYKTVVPNILLFIWEEVHILIKSREIFKI